MDQRFCCSLPAYFPELRQMGMFPESRKLRPGEAQRRVRWSRGSIPAFHPQGQPPHTSPSSTGLSPNHGQYSGWTLAGSPHDPPGTLTQSSATLSTTRALPLIGGPAPETKIGPHLSRCPVLSAELCQVLCPSACWPQNSSNSPPSAMPRPQPQAAGGGLILLAPELL